MLLPPTATALRFFPACSHVRVVPVEIAAIFRVARDRQTVFGRHPRDRLCAPFLTALRWRCRRVLTLDVLLMKPKQVLFFSLQVRHSLNRVRAGLVVASRF